ncbi:S-adenosyl-L-methionine-dependent methyltransferase [Lentinula aciculospora]|uniref:S-adenosyl-L-methionine-dependent methyltransferase n=1 Tax=Lentinula aciculospora TaxID=153920 RepID=A0A9W9DN86_9AGAR|nr:S-adenosyl-L-methionine-dependent methyltransferase [Lentinula aciculospora]
MGRGRKRGGRGGGGRGKQAKPDEYRTDLIEKSDMKNERFFAYYKAQKIVPQEEWEDFLEALRTPLPTTFRVAGSRQIAKSLNQTIKDVHVPLLSDVTFEDQKLPPPVQLPWYPDGLAWQFNISKKVLRKSPEFKKFHSFLVFETEVGNISRQEAVSMLPPLFLEVEPHHTVMDMCAAPGSKTAQLLEALHAQDTLTSTSIPSGLLVANDSDYKRTHLLIHQSARLPSPAFMVTNLDASNYPSIRLPAPSGASRKDQLLFDRILCDVPCSGDGTLRKNIGIWKHWQPNDGNGLHGLQLRILQRAMKMLKSDGRIVYSTCSINPVENEAVIAAALESNPEYHLVDVSSNLPELKRRPGMTSWRPTADKSISSTYDTYEAFIAANPQAAVSTKLTSGHWPPSNVHELNLERCMRIYPHLQDSGGFFVAVLERKSTELKTPAQARERKRMAENVEPLEPGTKKPRLESEPESSSIPVDLTTDIVDQPATDEGGGGGANGSGNGSGNGSFKEMPYTFLSPLDPTLLSCISRLRLTPEFPSSNVLVRNPEGDVVRSMYLTNDLIKQIILANDFTKIRLTAAGTKVFTKQEGGKGMEAQYRILGEGLPVVLPYTTSIITGKMSVLRHLVMSHYPLCTSFEESFRPVLDSLDLGCHIFRFPPGELDGASLTHDLLVPIWKSGVSVSLMVDKKAKNALSLRVFGVEVPPSMRDRKTNADGDKVALGGELVTTVELEGEAEAEVEMKGDETMLVDVEVSPEPERVVVQAL